MTSPPLRLEVACGARHRVVEFESGQSIRDILAPTDCRPMAACRGTGACGLCRVLLEGGEPSPPTAAEELLLAGPQLATGTRLACQTCLQASARLTVELPSPRTAWRGLEVREIYPVLPACPASGEGRDLALAVDLGTTHVCLTVLDPARGCVLGSRTGLNSQHVHGTDVVSRLQAAAGDPGTARQLAELAFEAIGQGLQDLCLGEGLNPRNIRRVVLVGNTALTALLTGRNYLHLLEPGRWSGKIDCLPEHTEGWAGQLLLHPEATFFLPPVLQGFIGSDVLAGALAVRLAEDPAPALFIDFGTNSEVLLWDGNFLWGTSAAGGPALEGVGVSCGLPASPGAAWRVHDRGTGLEAEVLGGLAPAGFCGSGLIDVIALARRRGWVDEIGRLPRAAAGGVELLPDAQGRPLCLTRRDVDLIQRAKAAVATAWRSLLQASGLEPRRLRRILVAGAFGRYLQPSSAFEIGLLPSAPDLEIELCGNTALAGAGVLAATEEPAPLLENLIDRFRGVNLTESPGFHDAFMNELFLRPARLS